jgi:hypothetical protein
MRAAGRVPPKLTDKSSVSYFLSVFCSHCLLMFSFSAGDFVSGLRPNLRPLGGLQDGPETGFFGTAKRYYNFVFTDLAGKCLLKEFGIYCYNLKKIAIIKYFAIFEAI